MSGGSGAGQTERYRTACELSGDLKDIGINLSVPGVRITLVALSVPRIGYMARFSDLLKAMQDNPDYRPFAKNAERRRSPVTVM
jgi:hypothetical protein